MRKTKDIMEISKKKVRSDDGKWLGLKLLQKTNKMPNIAKQKGNMKNKKYYINRQENNLKLSSYRAQSMYKIVVWHFGSNCNAVKVLCLRYQQSVAWKVGNFRFLDSGFESLNS